MGRYLLLLSSVGLLGCAVGTSSRLDRRARADGPVADARQDSPAPVEGAAREGLPDRRRDSTRPLDLSPDHSSDRPRDKAAPDLCPPCGVGMVCSKGSCVCDPKTCTTSDPCKTASCATGTCVIAAIPGAPYPCPGAYGTLCGGSTGVLCNTGLVCATFGASGSTGFCTEYCTSQGSVCSNAPSGTTADCSLTGSSGKYLCGFVCLPGVCPKALYCDFNDSFCKP